MCKPKPLKSAKITCKTKLPKSPKIAKLEGTINTPHFAQFFNFVIYTTMDTWRGCDNFSLLRPDPDGT